MTHPDPTPAATDDVHRSLQLTFFTWYAVQASCILLAAPCLGLAAIWALTTPDEPFWPAWVMSIALALFVGHVIATASIRGLRDTATRRLRLDRVGMVRAGFELHAAVAAAVVTPLWCFWLIEPVSSGSGRPPWPVWPSLVWAFVLLLHLGTAVAMSRDAAYRSRLSHVEATRSGVVEAQELELRRIERDLHDGAQARLVSLGMQLGLAAQRLDGDPVAARALLEEARESTRAALRELRDLARGIYPPVLADRGLVPAIRSLVASSPLSVEIEAEPGDGVGDTRLPAAIEGALYFVAAEAIANVGKHAAATHAVVRVRRGAFDVVLTVQDDGVGGANATGSGIAGLRQRVEALDGRLTVTSPTGGPTLIRAELPCER